MPRSAYSSAIATSIGQRIMQARDRRGLSQSQLAEQLDLSYQQVQKYEKGTSGITVGRLVQIAAVLDVDIEELLRDVLQVAEQTARYRPPGQHEIIVDTDELRLVKAYRRLPSAPWRTHLMDYVRLLGEGQALSSAQGAIEPDSPAGPQSGSRPGSSH
ncbi:MAG: XRE family transcriptional regulator [Spirochaetaceae bacterium]|nr:MAG: XRE family transcriptional regulator [Spirochaetaceae bacterium]